MLLLQPGRPVQPGGLPREKKGKVARHTNNGGRESYTAYRDVSRTTQGEARFNGVPFYFMYSSLVHTFTHFGWLKATSAERSTWLTTPSGSTKASESQRNSSRCPCYGARQAYNEWRSAKSGTNFMYAGVDWIRACADSERQLIAGRE